EPPKAVAHQHWPFSKSSIGANRLHFLCIEVRPVFAAVTAVTHAAPIERCVTMVVRKKGRDEIPPMRMRISAMNEQESGFAGLAPAQIMNARAFNLDETVFKWRGDRPREPFRRADNFIGSHSWRTAFDGVEPS